MKTFSKVRVSNNWEILTTYVGKEVLDWNASYRVDIKWPDGTIECNLPVKWKERQASVSDHGHVYTYTSCVAMVQTEHHGLKFDVPLEKFRVRFSTKTKKTSKR